MYCQTLTHCSIVTHEILLHPRYFIYDTLVGFKKKLYNKIKKIFYFPNKINYHQVATVPMMPFDPKSTLSLRPAQHFR